MLWSEHVYTYCERGSDPSFWAEPVNASTNAAFLLAAMLSALAYQRLPPHERGRHHLILIGLVFVIGLGSFIFHTFATRWASLADSIPIAIFMLAYFVFVLRRFFALDWLWVGLWLSAFIIALGIGGAIECQPSFLPESNARGGPCLNGTIAYLPALFALFTIAFALVRRGHPSARLFLTAGGVFAVSMVLRTLDFELCANTRLFGAAIGTHFMWHLLNAVVLYVLLRAALLHGGGRTGAKGLQ